MWIEFESLSELNQFVCWKNKTFNIKLTVCPTQPGRSKICPEWIELSFVVHLNVSFKNFQQLLRGERLTPSSMWSWLGLLNYAILSEIVVVAKTGSYKAILWDAGSLQKKKKKLREVSIGVSEMEIIQSNVYPDSNKRVFTLFRLWIVLQKKKSLFYIFLYFFDFLTLVVL